jgi:HAD superfamily hydrolase (TIGR01509 family)
VSDLPRPALVFDFGNVLAHFDYGRVGERLGRRLGTSGPALLERVRAAGLDGLMKEYESGKMTAEDFGRAVAGLAGMELTHAEFVAAWSDIFWLNESVAELVAALKRRGYRLVLGSNTNDLHAAHFRRQFADALGHFDRLVLSYEVGHVKPAREFYLACAEAAGRSPADCVFIDDLAENVAGARAAGLAAIHYRDTPSLVAELRSMGIAALLPDGRMLDG